MKHLYFENKDIKGVSSENFNFLFNKNTGFTATWGRTKEEDPKFSPVGPLILDIEISTVCNGISKTVDSRRPCSWCYKSNTGCGTNMSLETYKTVLNKLPKSLTQVAFGIGDIDGNPDLWDIMEYTRSKGIVPNITTNGMGVSQEIANKLANLCGAVSVSRYHIPDICYDAIDKLTKAGLKQQNIHQLLSAETYDSCFKLLDDVKNDSRLSKLNAVVFLKLKPKGDRNKYHSIETQEQFDKLIKTAQDMGITVGMDSCTAPMMLKYAERYNQNDIIKYVEPCESTLFSLYINVAGEAFPCSFTEGTKNWEKGISMLEIQDFLKDVWYSQKLSQWREGLIDSSSKCNRCALIKYCRSCPAYDITPCRSYGTTRDV
jgi:radical SAM protein with 4Fe4S-binding SPASM domain